LLARLVDRIACEIGAAPVDNARTHSGGAERKRSLMVVKGLRGSNFRKQLNLHTVLD
jgi:hypothetical protein